jgi:hypothetical protein
LYAEDVNAPGEATMRRLLLTVAGALFLAAPARAEGPIQPSLGYSFVKYLKEDAGCAPVGAFLALSGRGGLSPEVDLGWQRDTDDPPGGSVTLNLFTAVVGLRYGFRSSGAVRPFLHLLGGVRHDHVRVDSHTAWGGFAGGGVDIMAGERLAVRLGADFQIFDETENLNKGTKTLRLGVGLTF